MTPNQAPSVLIVEDERIVAMDIQRTLQELGYDAFAIASSADEAIARTSERCPDIVLMDIRIKGQRDGIETAELLRNKFAVPVVYLTAHTDESILARAKKTEPHGYLLKPVTSSDLRSVIEVSLYRHEMEKRLRERERWFSTTLHSIADAVITIDLGGAVTFMNSAAEALTGAEAEAAIGKPLREILRLVDRGAGADLPPLQALRERRAVELEEGNLVNASSGAHYLINDSAAPVVDGEQVLGAVMVFRDVTDKKKLQKQLELADRLTSLGTMAAGVAHELNNPLAVVVANAGVIAEDLSSIRAQLAALDTTPPEVHQQLAEMARALPDLRSAANRIGHIVANLRVFSRPEAPSTGSVDVVRCVQWAIQTTAHEFRHRASLVTNLRPVPCVRADETKLGQVIVNLLVNAAQAIAPGRADHNEVSIATRVDSTGQVAIEVRDTGAGIPGEALDRIFEPFFTTKEVGDGTGLGLSICHGIVRSLGGDIQVESDVDHGTLFRIVLPVAAPEPASSGPPHTNCDEPVRGRILVIDDEEMVLRVLRRVLRDHDVCCVQSAQEALALIDDGTQFDLILSDLMMPTMTGIDFYEKLLAQRPELARRVVFLSGGAITARGADFLNSVPNRHIEKPFQVTALQDTIQQLLKEYRAQRS